MAAIVPRIFKHKLSPAVRWPVKYTDIEQSLVVPDDVVIHLHLHFMPHNSDYAASMSGGPPKDRLPDGLNLVTLRYDTPGSSTTYWQNNPLPDGEFLVDAYVWAVPRDDMLARRIRRESLRDALSEEIATLARGGLFDNRWVLQIRARPNPDRLEGLRTVWTGIRRENTQRRMVLLPIEDAEDPIPGRVV
jgi:hypothetical protein